MESDVDFATPGQMFGATTVRYDPLQQPLLGVMHQDPLQLNQDPQQLNQNLQQLILHVFRLSSCFLV